MTQNNLKIFFLVNGGICLVDSPYVISIVKVIQNEGMSDTELHI